MTTQSTHDTDLIPLLAPSGSASEIIDIDIDLIIESRTNPRTNFDPAYIADLAATIKPPGRVLQPILLRPLPASRVEDTAHMRPRPTHEIVFGACRYRGSREALAKTIRATVEDLTDAQVLIIQLVENLKRKDLTELEEAQGYFELLQNSDLTIDQVAREIRKSRSYVFGRLKLLDLSQECKQALRAGQIDASRAILIARIPDSALQAKALTEATRKDSDGDTYHSVRAFETWLQKNVMLRLEHAHFRTTDSTLVPAAGSCKDCPKRTGANPDLFADVDGADICTDPACYHAKEDAQRTHMLATAEAKGMRLVDGKEAKEICNQHRDTLNGYLPLSQVRGDLVNGDEAKLGTLLGKDAPPAVLIENPWTKELVAAVPTAEAEAVLVLKGLIKVAQQSQNDRKRLEADLASLKAQTDAEIQRRARLDMYEALATGIRATPDADARGLISNSLLREYMFFQVGYWDTDDFSEWLGIEIPDDLTHDDRLTHLRLHIQACDSAKLWRALAVHMISGETSPYFRTCGQGHDAPLFEPVADALGIDLQTIKDNAAADVKHDMAQEIKRIKGEIKALDSAATLNADARKAGIPIAPLAQPTPADGQATPTAKKPVAKKAKLSAEDAQQAIAAAMQSQAQAETTPHYDQPADDATAIGPGLRVGRAVRVTSDTDKLPLKTAKYAGKEGTISERHDADHWWVSFKGRSGGLACFAAAELEVI